MLRRSVLLRPLHLSTPRWLLLRPLLLLRRLLGMRLWRLLLLRSLLRFLPAARATLDLPGSPILPGSLILSGSLVLRRTLGRCPLLGVRLSMRLGLIAS